MRSHRVQCEGRTTSDNSRRESCRLRADRDFIARALCVRCVRRSAWYRTPDLPIRDICAGWDSISELTLSNLVRGMQSRIRPCVDPISTVERPTNHGLDTGIALRGFSTAGPARMSGCGHLDGSNRSLGTAGRQVENQKTYRRRYKCKSSLRFGILCDGLRPLIPRCQLMRCLDSLDVV